MPTRSPLPTTLRTSLSPLAPPTSRRAFRTTALRHQEAASAPTAPARKPVGAFRGGMLGFFAGSTLAGLGVYYYILDEYRIANEMLADDIYSLRAAVQRTEAYTRSLEDRVVQIQSQRIQGKK